MECKCYERRGGRVSVLVLEVELVDLSKNHINAFRVVVADLRWWMVVR